MWSDVEDADAKTPKRIRDDARYLNASHQDVDPEDLLLYQSPKSQHWDNAFYDNLVENSDRTSRNKAEDDLIFY